eukprot:jgi/Hompol1/1846/HPOL_002777-RA
MDDPNVAKDDEGSRTASEIDAMDAIPIDDMYYSLEYDAELLASLAIPESKESSDIHDSLKHMFRVIYEKADPMQLKSLKKLLMEVRPSKSKWASDDRVGQEQLYEAMEFVLNELRNYTMTKKLKALQYPSKADFTRDLNLIWQNCMTYNTIPDSIYRRHASAMKRKATDLLKKVPDITVRNAGAEESDSDDEVKQEAVATSAATQPITVSSKITSTSSTQIVVKMEVDDSVQVSNSITSTEALDTAMDAVSDLHDMESTTTTQPGHQPQSQRDNPADDACLQIKKWKQSTIKVRSEYLRVREEQIKLPFGQRLALIRRSDRMQDFSRSFQAHIKSNAQRRKALLESKLVAVMRDSALDPSNSRQAPVDTSATQLDNSGLQSTAATDESVLSQPKPAQPALLLQTALNVSSESAGGADPVTEQGGEPVTPHQPDEERIQALRDADFSKAFLPELKYTANSLPQIEPIPSNRTGDLVSFFETPHRNTNMPYIPPAPMPSMSEYAEFRPDHHSQLNINIMKNIRELQRIKETYAHIVEIVMRTLDANSIEPSNLDFYVRNDVARTGIKLTELRRKLDSFFSAEQLVNQDDIEFDDAQGHIISGNFFQDLGIDMLNLKEFGLDVVNIPPDLWNRNADKRMRVRVRRATHLDAMIEERPDDAIKPSGIVLEDWAPVDPLKQIGLLRSFYDKKGMSIPDLAFDEKRSKTKEEKQLLKHAQTGRKRVMQMEDMKLRRRRPVSDGAAKQGTKDAKRPSSTASKTATSAGGVGATSPTKSAGGSTAGAAGATGATGAGAAGSGTATKKDRRDALRKSGIKKGTAGSEPVSSPSGQ